MELEFGVGRPSASPGVQSWRWGGMEDGERGERQREGGSDGLAAGSNCLHMARKGLCTHIVTHINQHHLRTYLDEFCSPLVCVCVCVCVCLCVGAAACTNCRREKKHAACRRSGKGCVFYGLLSIDVVGSEKYSGRPPSLPTHLPSHPTLSLHLGPGYLPPIRVYIQVPVCTFVHTCVRTYVRM